MREGLEQSRHKRWWRAVWRGLVVDDGAKHYHAMGSALWLYLYFIIHADPKSGTLGRKYKTVARDMGVKARTVRAWLSKLQKGGYVSAQSSGRSLVIHIRKWKSFFASSKVTHPRSQSVSDLPL
jgi:hypothetical protein